MREQPQRELERLEKTLEKMLDESKSEVDFRCPITLSLIEHPVIAPDGKTYEREALLQWARTCRHSNHPVVTPNSRVAFNEGTVVSNLFYAQLVDERFPIFKRILQLKQQIEVLPQQAEPLEHLIQAPASIQAHSAAAQLPAGLRSSTGLFSAPVLNEDPSLRMKVVLVGNPGFGIKSTLIARFVHDDNSSRAVDTMGVDFLRKAVEVDQQKVILEIWDSAGQERFRAITRSMYHGASAIFLVYNAEIRDSFDQICDFKAEVDTVGPEGTRCYLIAENSGSRLAVVSAEQGQALAADLGIPFHQCSSEQNDNVAGPFLAAAGDFMSSRNQVAASVQAESSDESPQRQHRSCSVM